MGIHLHADSVISPTWKLANDLTSFIDAGRRHRTPGSEIKTFITHSTAGCMSLMFISGPLFPQVLWGSRGVVWVVDTVDLYTAKEIKSLESPSLVKRLASKSVNF